MNTFSNQADQEQQFQTSDIWPENLEGINLDIPYPIFNQPAECSWPWSLNASWSSQQLQIDTPDGTCGTPQWSGSFAMGTVDQPSKPDFSGHSIGSSMGMEMDFLEEAVEDKPCLQQAASSEFDTPMLNMASWADPTASFRSHGQVLNNFQPTLLQHEFPHRQLYDQFTSGPPHSHIPYEFIELDVEGYYPDDDYCLLDPMTVPRFIPMNSNAEPWNVLTSQAHLLSNTEIASNNQDYPSFTHYTYSSPNRQYESQSNSTHNFHRSTQQEQLEKPPGSNPAGKPPRFGPSNGPPQEDPLPEKSKGGRHQGLSPKAREKAREMRIIHACWPCKLLRNSCIRSDSRQMCQGCEPKLGKTNPLTCSHTALKDFTPVFLPNILFGPLEDKELQAFTQDYVTTNVFRNKMTVDLDSGFGRPYRVSVYEVIPNGQELLVSKQFRLNKCTQKHEAWYTWSPPLAMDMETFKSTDFNTYLEETLYTHWKGFLKSLFRHRNEWNFIQRKVLNELHRYYRSFAEKNSNSSSASKANLLLLCLKLIVINFMMSRVFAISEKAKQGIWEKLCSQNKVTKPHGTFSSPRLVNKQLKFLLSTMFQKLFTDILSKIQALLLQSKKEPWPEVFASVLALSMVVESLQMMILCKKCLNPPTSTSSSTNSNADILEIDVQFHFVLQLLQTKYKPRGANCWRPLNSKSSYPGLARTADREFVDNLVALVEQHGEYLRNVSTDPLPKIDDRGGVPGTCGRILAQFLLSLS